jgi:myosin heavy subunit
MTPSSSRISLFERLFPSDQSPDYFCDLFQGSLKIMGINEEEQLNLFKTVAAVLHFGNVSFAQSRRSEYADGLVNNELGKVAHLLGLSEPELSKALLKPRIKVGNEYTVQGRTVEQVRQNSYPLTAAYTRTYPLTRSIQVVYSVEALSKATYERMFKWLVARINKALETKTTSTNFIGVLDIAGFEIFKVCIVYGGRSFHNSCFLV